MVQGYRRTGVEQDYAVTGVVQGGSSSSAGVEVYRTRTGIQGY